MEISFDELRQLLSASAPGPLTGQVPYDNGMVRSYVVVRCKDAGVHAGFLESHHGRECVLKEARRLWYWKPAGGSAFLSGVAVDGLDPSSKVGKPVSRLHLTENCEIMQCTEESSKSIRSQENHNE